MDEFHHIGKPTPLIDAPDKVTGAAKYVADIRVPGALAGKVLRSPHPHARILGIQADKAERVPGVCAVVTAVLLSESRRKGGLSGGAK